MGKGMSKGLLSLLLAILGCLGLITAFARVT